MSRIERFTLWLLYACLVLDSIALCATSLAAPNEKACNLAGGVVLKTYCVKVIELKGNSNG